MSACWVHPVTNPQTGYGMAWVADEGGRRKVLTHRAAYEALVGAIPEGLQIDHLCRNRACYNPAHLEAVTRQENVRRGLRPQQLREQHASVTHCPAGHAYDERNTYRNKRGQRCCRACARDRYHRRRKVVAYVA